MYLISTYDASFKTSKFVANDGHTYTLHADKAYHFPTFEAALNALLHFPNHLIQQA